MKNFRQTKIDVLDISSSAVNESSVKSGDIKSKWFQRNLILVGGNTNITKEVFSVAVTEIEVSCQVDY